MGALGLGEPRRWKSATGSAARCAPRLGLSAWVGPRGRGPKLTESGFLGII